MSIIAALLVVGAVSHGIIRHIVQTSSLWIAIFLGIRRSGWSKWACFFFWLLLMTAMWLFLLGWARIVSGTFSTTETAMTLIVGAGGHRGDRQGFGHEERRSGMAGDSHGIAGFRATSDGSSIKSAGRNRPSLSVQTTEIQNSSRQLENRFNLSRLSAAWCGRECGQLASRICFSSSLKRDPGGGFALVGRFSIRGRRGRANRDTRLKFRFRVAP